MNRLTTRVALRYLAASTPSASAIKLLQGMAKGGGKTGMVNLNLLIEALTVIGWRVEETVGVTRLTGDDQIKTLLAGFVRDHRAEPWGYAGVKEPKEFWFSSEAAASTALPHLLRAVTKVPPNGPDSPRVGGLYVASVSGPTNDSHDPNRWILRTQFWWYGVSAWRFTTPSGQTTTIGLGVDDRGRLADPTSMKIPAFWTWAYGNGLQQAALTFLDDMGATKVEEATRAQGARTLDNTGTCPCCFSNVKLANGTIMRHGWMVGGHRGWGQYGNTWHTQACYGFHYQPLEISKEGTTDYLDKAVKPSLVRANGRLHTLLTNPPAELYAKGSNRPVPRPDGFVFDPNERSYPYNSYGYLLSHTIREVQEDIHGMGELQRTLEAAIMSWTPKPLPGTR